jgi:hypothetical protein
MDARASGRQLGEVRNAIQFCWNHEDMSSLALTTDILVLCAGEFLLVREY